MLSDTLTDAIEDIENDLCNYELDRSVYDYPPELLKKVRDKLEPLIKIQIMLDSGYDIDMILDILNGKIESDTLEYQLIERNKYK